MMRRPWYIGFLHPYRLPSLWLLYRSAARNGGPFRAIVDVPRQLHRCVRIQYVDFPGAIAREVVSMRSLPVA